MFWLLVFTTVCNKARPAHLPTGNSFLHRGLSLHVAKTILERTFIEMCIICEAQNVQTHCSVYYAQISLLGEGDMDMEKGECTLQSLMFMRGNYPLLFCLSLQAIESWQDPGSGGLLCG